MSKIIREDCKYISIYQLKKWGFLGNKKNDTPLWSSDTITWTRNFDNKKSSVDYTIDLSEKTLKLKYRIRNNPEEEWQDVENTYPIVSTPCTYGGIRYWFICSVCNHGVYCGRRVAKLYLGANSHYFACRHCYNLSYESRNKNLRGKYGYLTRFFDLEEEIDELWEKTKIRFRKGKPTKNYQKLLYKQDILGDVSEKTLDLLDKI